MCINRRTSLVHVILFTGGAKEGGRGGLEQTQKEKSALWAMYLHIAREKRRRTQRINRDRTKGCDSYKR